VKVEEIRREEYVEEYVRLHARDVEQTLRFRDSFVRVPCPACDSKTEVERFEKSGFRFVECSSCGTLFVSPRPDAGALERFYSTAKSFALYNSKIFPASEDVRRRSIFAPRAERVKELFEAHSRGRPGVLIDVGAGFGTFCEEAAKLDFFEKVVAIEPSAGLAATCRRKGLEVIESPVETARTEVASVVTCFELIEHLFDPAAFVRACANVLVDDGLLIVTTPNIRGFDLETLGPISENVDAPEHLNYFHPASLTALLERSGFAVCETLTPGKLDAELVRMKALAGRLDLSSQPFLRRVLIDEWDRLGVAFQEFLARAGCSSHLWVVARRARAGA
jgi:SAM-dependent methyltransferase/Zn ribbon nucleic-acid-binding protein